MIYINKQDRSYFDPKIAVVRYRYMKGIGVPKGPGGPKGSDSRRSGRSEGPESPESLKFWKVLKGPGGR